MTRLPSIQELQTYESGVTEVLCERVIGHVKFILESIMLLYYLLIVVNILYTVKFYVCTYRTCVHFQRTAFHHYQETHV